ncbi:hypothetical protein BKE38_05040 [Pseudoroseomonas deserti]|uniref:Uncharacterized protein n=1 Tax=Teichococcus deserti TaxID=1817963 RepID=A0A1V2H6S8_9PROT|nr:hypothetical protein [Pseudoroseomonas deserti]ONG56961.1 hypothetical protein BKE38_05040 [Pseudoroseomonas deserti]
MAMPKGEPAKLPLTGAEKARLLQGSPMRPVIAEISAIVQLVLSQITTTKGDPGLSAYQIAQKLGFTGSEAD